eukprot:Gb_10034 [translate_table: standard]
MEAKKKIKSTLQYHDDETNIRLMSIPDGLEPHDRRTSDLPKVFRALENSMVPSLEKLIQEINENEEHKVTCLIVDLAMPLQLDVAKRYDISRAALYPGQTAACALRYNIPTLVSSNLLPPNGVPEENKMVKYLPSVPPLHSAHLPWLYGRSKTENEFRFESGLRIPAKMRETEWTHFNSWYDLEAPLIDEFSKQVGVLPIGPLIPPQFLHGDLDQKKTVNNTGLWTEDLECLDWLDRQSPCSVIYVSFGSLAVFNATQLEELALGLEATQKPFLWVVRNDLMDGTTAELPSKFTERIKDRGCLVSWAPQLSVLSHSSVACFITHCGWSSTLESISMGVPMICWPNFGDQFLDRSYIVEVWKVGVALNANKNGLIQKDEIVAAVQRLMSEEQGKEIKKRVTNLKESCRTAGAYVLPSRQSISFYNLNALLATGSHSLAVPVACHAMPWHPSGDAMAWHAPAYSGEHLHSNRREPYRPHAGVRWRLQSATILLSGRWVGVMAPITSSISLHLAATPALGFFDKIWSTNVSALGKKTGTTIEGELKTRKGTPGSAGRDEDSTLHYRGSGRVVMLSAWQHGKSSRSCSC